MRIFLNCVVLVAVVLALSAGQLRAETVLANVAAFELTDGTDPYGYPTANGNDDSPVNTFTHGDDGYDSWWTVNLGQQYTIDHVDVYSRGDYPSIPDLQLRTNGATLQGYADNVGVPGTLGDPVGDPIILAGHTGDFPRVTYTNGAGPWTGVQHFKISGEGMVQYLHVADFGAFAEVEKYPNFISGVTATATESFASPAVSPTFLVNNMGMDDQRAGMGSRGAGHYTVYGGALWHSDGDHEADPVLTFDLGGTYGLTKMVIWNEDQTYEGPGARGIKECTIEVSTDGIDYTPLPNTNGEELGNYTLHPTDGSGGPYLATDNIGLGGVTASHVRLTAHSSFGSPYMGLDEVRFYQVPEPSMLVLLAFGGLVLLGRRMK